MSNKKRPDVLKPEDRPPDLVKWLEYLGISDCTCPDGWRGLGVLHGVRMGYGWVRLSTTPNCPHHDIGTDS
jgi:hypothetical protein